MALYEDDIDLRPYILTLIQHWWIILLIVSIAAGFTLLFSLQQPRGYKATATILISRSQSQLSLADRFPIISDPTDPAIRLATFMSILETDGFASESLQALVDAGVFQTPIDLESFKSMVEMENDGDILRITANSNDPQQAAEIANTWGRLAVQKINMAYLEEQPLEEVQAQITTARAQFSSKQKELEEFIQHDERPLLQQQIDQAQLELDKIKEDKRWWVDYYTRRRQSLRDLVIQAQGLMEQIQNGSSSSAATIGDSLAVVNARLAALDLSTTGVPLKQYDNVDNDDSEDNTNIFYSFPAQSPTLQIIDLASLQAGAADAVEDLEGVIRLAEAQIAIVDKELETITERTLNEENDPVAESLNVRLQDLKAQVEALNTLERELFSQRDLSWQIYQVLAQKESEILTGTRASSFANLAAPAAAPQLPAPRGALRNSLLAGTAGLILTIGWFVIIEWWRGFKAPIVRTRASEPAD